MNKRVQEQEVEVKEVKELWSEYVLSDGNTIRIKPVVTKVIQKLSEDNNPTYTVSLQHVIVVKDWGGYNGRHHCKFKLYYNTAT